MEVEIKLRLPDAAAHGKVQEALKGSFRVRHDQENFFFDGSKKELSKGKVTCRLRFYGKDKRAVICSKGRQALKDGVGIATEEEEDIDPVAARQYLTHPDKLLALDCTLMNRLRSQYNLEALTFLGGFENTRHEYEYEGFVLELDETKYEWGTTYEIEVETADPEQLKVKLEAFLKVHDIPFTYSSTTKFANFRHKTLT
ncbi:hypothetical protein WJX72_004266 [[Myrmecia] bisecta]|uniref:CYTH domain-containing protein n=1 Tax=[Myrmecia] bisecta TaxID=41462 RepID=A0AAW1QF20_9CHLO